MIVEKKPDEIKKENEHSIIKKNEEINPVPIDFRIFFLYHVQLQYNRFIKMRQNPASVLSKAEFRCAQDMRYEM